MSKTPTSSASSESKPVGFDDGGMDFAAFEALSENEIAAAATSDPDTRAPDKDVSLRARRVGLHGVIRLRLGLTFQEFEARYHIPATTLLAWERGALEPDAVARALIAIIAADPSGVAETMAKLPRVPEPAE
jgi:putative transcriptional regulator